MDSNQTKQRMGARNIDPRFGKSFIAREAAVASPNELATIAGNKVLQNGGNAIDAMVAVNSTLGVVFPHMTGPGGDSFWIIHEAATGKQYCLNASDKLAVKQTGMCMRARIRLISAVPERHSRCQEPLTAGPPHMNGLENSPLRNASNWQ